MRDYVWWLLYRLIHLLSHCTQTTVSLSTSGNREASPQNVTHGESSNSTRSPEVGDSMDDWLTAATKGPHASSLSLLLHGRNMVTVAQSLISGCTGEQKCLSISSTRNAFHKHCQTVPMIGLGKYVGLIRKHKRSFGCWAANKDLRYEFDTYYTCLAGKAATVQRRSEYLASHS